MAASGRAPCEGADGRNAHMRRLARFGLAVAP
jgi:hypothetical protein